MDIQEQLLTIQQLSLRLNIPKPTLRFWEKELDGIIVPLRTRGGQRRYSVQHISIIEEVTNLKKRGVSLEEIRTEFNKSGKAKVNNSDPNTIDFLADRVAKVVKVEVYKFLSENTRII